jgi:hypothetical protein
MKESLFKLETRVTPPIAEDFVALASQKGLSPAQLLERLMRNAITGEARLNALKAYGAAQLEDGAKPRERGLNASEVIAASCTDGRARLSALQRIAAGNRTFSGE